MDHFLSHHPDWTATQEIFKILADKGHLCYLAGGCVRDFYLHRQPNDIDIVTDATPDQVQSYFSKTVAAGKSFGVIKVVLQQSTVDVATFRQEDLYFDGRHPEAIVWSSPEQDALRRDFTINALFYDMHSKKVIDYVGGLSDIQQKSLRAIGQPTKRFQEDHLRLLRAVRFAAQLNFNIEETTWNAILENKDLISTVSGERIHHELLQLLKSQFYLQGLKLFRESGLEEVLFAPTNPQKKVSRLQWLRGRSSNDHPEDEWLNWVYFFSDDAAYSTYLQRIRLSKKNQDLCKKALDFIFSLQAFFTLPLGQQLAQLMTQPYSEVLALLASADILLDEKWRDCQQKAQNLIQKKQLLQHPLPLLQFIHIAELPPGPLLKECLQQAYWHQLQHNLNNLQDMLNWFKNWRKDRI